MIHCDQAPEPRAHEVDQSPDRLLSCDPHAPPSERRRGGERRTTPVWASSDDLRRAASEGIRVRVHAPVVRGRLVAWRRSKKCKGMVMWMSVPCDRIRGLGASPEGIPTSTSSYSLEYVLGCLESVAQALAMYGRTLGRPLLCRSRAAVEPRSRASFRSLETYGGLGARYQVSGNIRSRISPRPLARRAFLGRDRRGSGRCGVWLRRGGRPRARLLRDVGKRLGGRI
jgi:hypothetical protein